MLDRLTSMRVFARVAALGSLSAAARDQRMSQTMATKHLASLEDRFGARLFNRTTRRLTLTEAGRTYLEAVERILAEVDEAEAAVRSAQSTVGGTLRVNAPVSFGIREVAPRLGPFLASHPGLTLDLGLNDRRVDLIEEGWDLVIRIGRMEDSTMIARRLARCATLICASPAYLEARGRPATIADLARHECLGYTLSRDIGVGHWRFGAGASRQVQVRGSLQANNGDVLVAAAVAGLGIVYQPAFLVYREIAAGSLVALDLDVATLEIDGIFAAYPASRRPPAKVRAFVDYLAAAFADPPWAVAGRSPPQSSSAAGSE